jgi:hypothetical protein
MAEWGGFLLAFWALWAIDQLKITRRNVFSFVAWGRRVFVSEGRLCFAGPWPGNWRVMAEDVPFSLSPAGIANRGAGQMARPADGPHTALAWRWEEIREVTTAKGWLCVNGARFCRDTGHVSAAALLALAKMPATMRRTKIGGIIRAWIRPAHLRRRATVLRARTALAAACNVVLLALALVLTAYLVRETIPLPEGWVERVTRALPWWGAGAVCLHGIGVVSAWRATRRLKVRGQDQRDVALFSAFMLPPQALRLRSLVGQGYFPPQHALSYVLAFQSGERARLAFQVWGDLRWPIGGGNDSPLAREIVAWFREELERSLEPHLNAAGLKKEELFAAPKPETAECRRYCPRCGDQFIEARERCPQGVTLLPLMRGDRAYPSSCDARAERVS